MPRPPPSVPLSRMQVTDYEHELASAKEKFNQGTMLAFGMRSSVAGSATSAEDSNIHIRLL